MPNDVDLQTSDDADEDALFLSVAETAALLRVDRKTVLGAIQRGELPGVRRLGRTLRINRAVLLSSDSTGQGRDPKKRGRS